MTRRARERCYVQVAAVGLMVVASCTLSVGQVAEQDGCAIKALAGGARHTLALRSDGTVWSWGENSRGQLGNDAVAPAIQDSPVQVLDTNGVDPLADIVAVAAGGWHSVALRSDGTVVAWGSNVFGQLGLNQSITQFSRMEPVARNVVDLATGDDLRGITAISAGSHIRLR